MSNQIIGKFKEFIVIEREVFESIEKNAQEKLEANKERPLSESSIEARSVLSVINYLKDNNIYNKDFELKN